MGLDQTVFLLDLHRVGKLQWTAAYLLTLQGYLFMQNEFFSLFFFFFLFEAVPLTYVKPLMYDGSFSYQILDKCIPSD